MKLNGARVGRDAGCIADEMIAHLAALPGATVNVTLEVHVRVGGGVEEDIVRTVSENATALKFDHASFEREYLARGSVFLRGSAEGILATSDADAWLRPPARLLYAVCSREPRTHFVRSRGEP